MRYIDTFIPFEQIKRKALKDPLLRKMYDDLEPEFAIARAMIEKRLGLKMTQAALAKKMGTKQSAIARLESGSYNPSIALLKKTAKALGGRLKVSITSR
jgi:DNA-binding XRE family transcriptional regulator